MPFLPLMLASSSEGALQAMNALAREGRDRPPVPPPTKEELPITPAAGTKCDPLFPTEPGKTCIALDGEFWLVDAMPCDPDAPREGVFLCVDSPAGPIRIVADPPPGVSWEGATAFEDPPGLWATTPGPKLDFLRAMAEQWLGPELVEGSSFEVLPLPGFWTAHDEFVGVIDTPHPEIGTVTLWYRHEFGDFVWQLLEMEIGGIGGTAKAHKIVRDSFKAPLLALNLGKERGLPPSETEQQWRHFRFMLPLIEPKKNQYPGVFEFADFLDNPPELPPDWVGG